MSKDRNRFSRTLWFARHPKLTALIYVGYVILSLLIGLVAWFLIIKFAKWVWNV